jgi:natural product biosynthesis luciferase-like monooxygenase protein
MFFSSMAGPGTENKYALLLEVARRADEAQFVSLWTPERHFHEFGGIFPNPSLTSAAVAVVTQRLQLRAGSLVSPLHHAIRIAEDWAVIDNLSDGRAAISFGSGWNVNDFAFFPERYERRKEIMYEQIALVSRLWRGETIRMTNSIGKSVGIRLFPSPIQAELPIWLTSSGDIRTFIKAGEINANVLTHLMFQDGEQLRQKIHRYREERKRHGRDPGSGIVSLMLHAYLDRSVETARERARGPLKEYFRSAIGLENEAVAGGGTVSGGRRSQQQEFADDIMDELLEVTLQRYLDGNALIGTVESARCIAHKFAGLGVDEIACLVDFGLAPEDVLGSLDKISQLADQCVLTPAVGA